MSKQAPYPSEVRERTIRLVFEQQDQYASQWAAITSIAKKAGMTAETLCSWVRQAEKDNGGRHGLSTEEKTKLKDLEREIKELRRANEILKAASAFFGAELDRQQRR
ncbi:transposase [soil metagenome]